MFAIFLVNGDEHTKYLSSKAYAILYYDEKKKLHFNLILYILPGLNI